MNYTSHTWVDGETITATKLNNIEQGVESASSYDGEVHYYWDGTSGHAPVITRISGDYTHLMELINDNISPNILFRYWQAANPFKTGTTSAIAIYGINDSYINFVAQIPLPVVGSSTMFSSLSFWWNSDNTLTL